MSLTGVQLQKKRDKCRNTYLPQVLQELMRNVSLALFFRRLLPVFSISRSFENQHGVSKIPRGKNEHLLLIRWGQYILPNERPPK